MTTTTIINGKLTTWNLTEMPTGEKLQANLIARGFDGKYYLGESIPTGRQIKRTSLFLRNATDGQFVYAL
jgi:hypothetical protein